MLLTSSAFKNNQTIPARYTCDGANTSPPLLIELVPPEAKTLALIMDDPDAPAGIFVHWVVWNIDPKTAILKEGETPSGGQQGINDFGNRSYGGPCPPSGTHRYFFKLYALNFRLDLNKKSDKQALESAMKTHVIAQAELIGLYKRSK